MDKNQYGVHRTHCCVKHGCKYGDKDCPVVKGEIRQDYTCERCNYDGINSVDELFTNINILQITNDLFSLIDQWEGDTWSLKEDEKYLEYKEKLVKYIKSQSRYNI
ncbi:MAG: hypothetical protein PHT02_01055 [Tissierellia bacterium]|nr:hypothetical protein [Tissierellia bacterium]